MRFVLSIASMLAIGSLASAQQRACEFDPRFDALRRPDVACERMAPAASSWIADIEYCAGTLFMTTEKAPQQTYAYSSVDDQTWKALRAAPSTGKFFNESIRPKHECRKRL